MTQSDFPFLGFGLGLRGQHFDAIMDTRPETRPARELGFYEANARSERPQDRSVAALHEDPRTDTTTQLSIKTKLPSRPVEWFEIISENYMNSQGRARSRLAAIREHYPIVMHGVALSIGTVDPLNSDYLKQLKALADWAQPAWISDHLCWTGIAHTTTHDLLPVPYTEAALAHIIARIRQVQEVLERPILLENPSTYLEFQSSAMPEAEFLARMAEEADCGLLLDVNNVYVSCYNHRLDPKTYLDTLPMERVAQIHLSGHSNKGTHIIDTHDDHVIDEVWALYRYVIAKAGPKNTMIEWDDNIPEFAVLVAELDKARHAARTAAEHGPLPRFDTSTTTAPRRNEAPDLSTEQQRMQDAILTGNAQVQGAELWIRPKPGFPATAQLQVYVNAYRWRLYDIVAEDFPVLEHLLGAEKFKQRVRAYVNATPPQHFDAAAYPSAFPEFMKTHWPEDTLAQEIATLENLIVQQMQVPDTAPLLPEQVAHLTPEALMEHRFHPRGALRLLAFQYPVNAYYTAVMEEEEPEAPAPAASHLALFRHADAMWRLNLDAEEFALLSQLFAGASIGEALTQLQETSSLDEATLASNINHWFSKWMQNGLLAA